MAWPKRRRYRQAGPSGDTGDYTAAYSKIARYEQQWFHALIKPKELKLPHIFEWLVKPEHLGKLRAAYPYANAWSRPLELDSLALPGGVVADFHIDIENAQILTPTDTICSVDNPHEVREPVLKACAELADMQAQFDVVRKVIRFFNEHKMTAGCVMEYFPTMRVLMPDSKVLQEVQPGGRFKDNEAIWDIMQDMRTAAFTIQQCLLLPDYEDRGANLFTVKCTKIHPTVTAGAPGFRFI